VTAACSGAQGGKVHSETTRDDSPIHQPTRAYKNLDFLASRNARVIRILAEYLEPLRRFRKEKVSNTIVFFGSSRALPRDVAMERLERAQGDAGKARRKALRDAETDLEMSRYYEDAVRLASMITKWSDSLHKNRHFIVCSGGGPGIMEAANRGAAEAGGKSVSLGISLPFESPNIYHYPNLSFEFHYFFMRKFWFAYLAKGLVVFPGGFGTLDECMETLTLLQTKKMMKKRKLPIVLYGPRYWKKVLNFDAMVNHRVLDPADLNLFTYCDTPEEAFAYIKRKLKQPASK